MKIRKAFYAGILLFLSLLITSCGLWRDFTVYFNTYYNAKTLFDQTEEAILKQKKDLFAFKEDQQRTSQTNIPQSSQNLQNSQSFQNSQRPQSFQNSQNPQNSQSIQNPQQSQSVANSSSPLGIQYISDLNKVIEKCSKILQYEKNSSYFEDALFMIGKAFFYEGEYPKAQRKFIELSGLGETKYSLENKLWLAKTYLQLRNFDEGLKLIEEVKTDAIKAKNDKIYMDASITKIGFFIYRLDYQKAIDECTDYLKVSKDDEINALVYYELGKIYLLVDDYKNALDSFNSALNFSPSFDIEFECRFESALLLKKLGKIDESAKIFETMRYQGKFKDKLDRILIELGQIYYEKKQAEKALIIFKDIDTTYRQTQSGGIAGMKIAKIYEKEYRDYDSSYKYYNKVSVANVPKDIKTEADKELKTIANYFELKRQQKEYNQQIIYRNKPQYFYQDSVDYSFVFNQYQERITKMTDSLKNSDSQKGILAQNYTFDQVGRMYIQQQDDLNRRKSRSQKIIDPQIYLVAKGIYKKPQKLKISLDSLQIMISQNLYNLGNLFYSELDAPDSAYNYFKNILKDYPNKPVTSQTMFALGIFYETNRDSIKADSIFKYVYNNFEKDPIRIEAGRKLGLIKKEDENFSINNRDTVEKAYTEAEQLAYDKKYLESINSFQKIYKNSPKSKYAAKSIYYCGLIYEENLKMYDSAAVEYGLLQDKEYINSAPAKAVSAKFLVYKSEKEKLKAEADKIKKESAQKDTLNQQKVNPETKKSVQDVNQKSGTNIHTEPLESKGKEINQSQIKDSPEKLDSLKMLNQKVPLSNPKSVPDKLKMEKDTTKKNFNPL